MSLSVSKSRLRLGWLIIVVVIVALGVPAALGLAVSQRLERFRLGIVGTAAPNASGRLAVELPKGFGLRPSEQREGWPALNGPLTVPASLAEHFELVLPKPVTACTFTWVWKRSPTVPVRLTLSFADAPGESYEVWHDQRRGGYSVYRGKNRVAEAEATWLLDVGELERRAPDGQAPLLLIHVGFTRQLVVTSPTHVTRRGRIRTASVVSGRLSGPASASTRATS